MNYGRRGKGGADNFMSRQCASTDCNPRSPLRDYVMADLQLHEMDEAMEMNQSKPMGDEYWRKRDRLHRSKDAMQDYLDGGPTIDAGDWS